MTLKRLERKAMAKILVLYTPVLHAGHQKLFQDNIEVETIYLLGEDFIKEIDYLEKELRALSPDLLAKSLAGWGLKAELKVLSLANLTEIKNFVGTIIMPDDDVSHHFSEKYLAKKEIKFQNVFLRWDRRNSVRQNKIANDQTVTSDEFSKKMISLAEFESTKSSDWWRHVGAVLIKDNKIISQGHNEHLPSDFTPYIDGDPRNCFHKGEHVELSTSAHIEARLIAEAAREGQSLKDAEMYVTTFPCPPCAKVIAFSGIKTLYYRDGYGILDGETVLKNAGIKICQVIVD